jgi:hypothetical protein
LEEGTVTTMVSVAASKLVMTTVMTSTVELEFGFYGFRWCGRLAAELPNALPLVSGQ